jgi:hypothetical protein
VTIQDEADGGTPAVPATAAARLSRLGDLKERRQTILEQAVLDRKVPRWNDPEIWVRYKPIDHSIIRAGYSRIESAPPAKKGEVEVNSNADLLIRACVGVYAKLPEDTEGEYSLRPGDPEGVPTRFDPDLATNLGLSDKSTAREVVRKLFITEGDIIAHAKAVAEFSGYTEDETDTDFLGE